MIPSVRLMGNTTTRWQDMDELRQYRSLGTVAELRALVRGPYPDSPDRAPLPFEDHSDPTGPYADECWDDRVTCGLLDGDA